MTPDESTSAKLRKNITVPEDLYRDFLSLSDDGESQRDLLGRLISTYREHVDLRDQHLADRRALNGLLAEREQEVDNLRSDLEDLRSGSQTTALASPAGQSSFSDFGSGAVRETMDAIKDVCDDETVCVKTALHMLDTKAAVVSKQLDRDHAAEQKHLDREDKDKDRQLKLDLADKRAQHEKDMAMIKKGVVKEEDMDGVVFLGSMNKGKTAGERLAERKKMAYHAANADDGDFEDPGDEDTCEGEESDDL